MTTWLLIISLQIISPQQNNKSIELSAEVERRYQRLTALMEQLVGSSKKLPQSGRLEVALKRSDELEIVPRLKKIRLLLEKRVLTEALDEEIILERDLLRILRILMGEDEGMGLREKQQGIDSLNRALADLKKIRDKQTENLKKTAQLMDAAAK